MKKVVLMLFAFLFLSINQQAMAYRIQTFSSDAKIIAAMRVLEQAGEQDVFRNLQKYGMRIKFDDLTMVTNGKNAFAVSTYNNFGTRVILINSAYKNAPAEQIACLIAHESYHTGYSADLEEETLATQKEASCWTRLKVASKTYPDSKLTRRLDKLSGLYLASSSDNNLVEQKIASNGFYRSQLGLN